ncbi:hypothetical protein [Streptomyces sp. enrichment culture]|uniref:hypothetical protein n=1 Tax=Streptomyces sp. enrichment culture TaxID=1795815 RepID=UPI003F54884C
MTDRAPAADAGPEGAGAGRLREALAEAAHDVTPSRVPLAAVQRRGRRLRHRRRATVLGAGGALLLLPLVLVARPGSGPHPAPATPPAASASPSPAPSVRPAPRVVAPGERVTAAPGFRLWLTAEGKHWTTPSLPDLEQFRSVVDGNIDRDTPGVSVQSEISDGRAYLSGLYYGGEGTASTVEIETPSGTVRGKLIELSGDPGWGVWYATADVAPDAGPLGSTPDVTVRTTEGGVYARLAAP